MLPARRLAVRHLRASSIKLTPSLNATLRRYASTKPSVAKPSIKSQIAQAFTNPAPPVLARYPTIYWSLRWLYRAIGAVLAWHIWCEYFFTFGQAEGISMLPTMNATGDWLLMSHTYRRGRGLEVGDLVSFKHPLEGNVRGVKRVVGMPGDFVLRDSPDTNGLMIQVPEGHCYIVGDNLRWSRDSRMFGPLPLALIKAKVIGRFSTSERQWTSYSDNALQPSPPPEDDSDVE